MLGEAVEGGGETVAGAFADAVVGSHRPPLPTWVQLWGFSRKQILVSCSRGSEIQTLLRWPPSLEPAAG